MANSTFPQAEEPPRTIEFRKALVHLKGRSAGEIEVPIFVGYSRDLDCDLGELFLRVEGEPRLLRPMAREYLDGKVRLRYFSKHVQETGKLPGELQLHWGGTLDDDAGGMILLFREARGNG